MLSDTADYQVILKTKYIFLQYDVKHIEFADIFNKDVNCESEKRQTFGSGCLDIIPHIQ